MPADVLDRPFTSAAAALARLDQAVSPLVGIVSTAVRTTYAPDDSRLRHWACAVSPTGRTLGSASVDYGGGAHANDLQARAAALGEAIERYSAAYVPHERLVLATAEELGPAAVDPRRFALFHPRQLSAQHFPFEAFTPSTRLDFAAGFALADGRPAFLPAQLVYLGRPTRGSARIGYPTSSGLACGPTLEEAVLAGLLEAHRAGRGDDHVGGVGRTASRRLGRRAGASSSSNRRTSGLRSCATPSSTEARSSTSPSRSRSCTGPRASTPLWHSVEAARRRWKLPGRKRSPRRFPFTAG